MPDGAPTTTRLGLSKPRQLEWGTHLCQLYRNRQDLVDVLVPFFAAGLSSNEQCLWITSAPLPAHEAKQALQVAVPDLDDLIACGQIEIIDHADWYKRSGRVEIQAVVHAWLAREKEALERGYAGLRLSGNTFWLERRDWESFRQYEAAVHAAFAHRRIIALCSYSLEACRSDDIVDVLQNHAFALARRHGEWDIVHNASTVVDWLRETSAALENEAARASRLEAERCRLHRAEEEARASARAAHEHLFRLQRVTAALSTAATVADIARVIVTDMAQAIGAEMAILAVPTNGEADLMLIDHAGLNEETSERFAIFPVTTDLPVAAVYRTGTPEWLESLEAIAQRFPDLLLALRRSHAIACAPLVIGDRRLGAVGFGFTRPTPATPELRALFDDLCKQVAMALERAHLYDDARRTRDRLQLLSDASTRMATGKLNLDDVLEALAAEVTRHVADCCAITLCGEHDDKLQLAALRHTDSTIEAELREVLGSTPAEVGRGITGMVAKTGEAALVPTIDPSMLQSLAAEHRGHHERHAIRSLVAVPLRSSGATIGVLTAAQYGSREPFDEEDRDLLQDLADRAGLAVDNARLYARVQDASYRKDEFLAVLGHELRNPLSPIVTALELMKMRGNTDSTREREVIERQVLHVRRLVDDLLDVSRITRGLIELRKERVTVSSLVERALEMVGPMIEQRNHRIHVFPCSEVVEVDPMRFGQILVNLLSNAARYTEPGGCIEVICGHRAGQATIAVRDTGIGISPEALPTIFEAFVQVQRNVESAQGGLGLGLSLVKSLVDLHGGTITVRSEGRGKGSEFTVAIPLVAIRTASGEDVSVSRDDACTPRGRRVLVVDDNSDAADSLGDLLRALGHDVMVVYDAPQALACAKEFHVEVAVLDIGLPVMDGYELGRRLEEQLGRPLRRIAVTGYGTDADRERSRAAGFAAHLTKPIEIDTLVERITDPQPMR